MSEKNIRELKKNAQVKKKIVQTLKKMFIYEHSKLIFEKIYLILIFHNYNLIKDN